MLHISPSIPISVPVDERARRRKQPDFGVNGFVETCAKKMLGRVLSITHAECRYCTPHAFFCGVGSRLARARGPLRLCLSGAIQATLAPMRRARSSQDLIFFGLASFTDPSCTTRFASMPQKPRT